MERKLSIKDQGQEIKFSDLDGENELKISTIDVDNRKTIVWLSTENIISLKNHIDYVYSKILNDASTESRSVGSNEESKERKINCIECGRNLPECEFPTTLRICYDCGD